MSSNFKEKLYSKYVQTHLATHELEERIRMREHYMQALIRKHFPEDKSARIIELGCGHGALIYHAAKLGYTNINGYDVSIQQVEGARSLGIDKVEQGSLMEVIQDIEDDSVDAIVTIDVIEHLTKDELVDFSDEVYRVLQGSGVWITHQPNAASPFFGRIRYGDLTHESAFTAESITQLMSYSGFTMIENHEDTPVIHGIKSRVRYILWLSIRQILKAYLVIETGSSREIFSQNFLTVGRKV